jgi:UDP-3-O-[3-hydroxymyristoyl] glucosamine N-acyltransferase
MKLTLAELASITQGEIIGGDPALVLTGFNSITEAQAGEVTFLGNARYTPKLKDCHASALLADGLHITPPEGMALVHVANPQLAFSEVVKRFGPPPQPFVPGIHPTAQISASAKLNRDTLYVGPHAVIEDEVEIGDGSAIHAGAFIGRGTRMGANCVLHANATVKERCVLGSRVIIHSGAVIGSDGFGYELKDGRHEKIEQVGIVQIDDDVEIGSCTAVDRARFGRTWIGEGTKVDNLVQIGHNCVIGKHCILCGLVGLSGSTRVGDYVVMAGQVGVAGHLTIGSKITVYAKSGVTKDLFEPGEYTGFPAKPLSEGRRMMTYPGKVPEILERLRELEARLKELEGPRAEEGHMGA